MDGNDKTNNKNSAGNDVDDHDPAYALADSFGIDTGCPSITTGESIVSALVNNTVDNISSMTDAEDVDCSSSLKTTSTQLKAMKAKAEAYTKQQLKGLTWDDFDIDSHKNPVGVFGIPFMIFTFKQICAIGLDFKIPWAHNSKKAGWYTIAGLVVAYKNREIYSELDVDAEGKKKKADKRQIQCPYWLINILFSGEFVDEFACIGNVVDRSELISGKAPNNQQFWERVQVAFADNSSYGRLHFIDNPMFVDSGIDPSSVVPHDWKKLHTIWKTVNSNYKEVYRRFTQSGNHAKENFVNYSKKLKHVYYLRQFILEGPQLHKIQAGVRRPWQC